MTIGPDPMTRTEEMSSRLGMCALLAERLDDEIAETVEQVVGVVRAARGLGVVLHREGGDVEGLEALHDVVVEAEVAHLDAAEAGGAVERAVEGRRDREAVVVRRDLDAARLLVAHGLVDAAVPERQLVGVEAE